MVVLPSSLVGRHLGKLFEVALNNLLISQHIRIVGCSFFITVVPTTVRKEAPTGNTPMGAIPPKAVTDHFPLTEKK